MTLKIKDEVLGPWMDDAMKTAQEGDDDLRHIIVWKKRRDIRPK